MEKGRYAAQKGILMKERDAGWKGMLMKDLRRGARH